MARDSKSYPALVLSQNQHRFYFTTIPVDDLFSYCFVARREEDPEIGFQRALSVQRAEDIAVYLAAGEGSIPTNIVLSAQEGSAFTYNSRAKTVSFARIPNAFLVLDGQHRLWGYQKCSIRHRVPVAIYSGLTRTIETKLFIDINTNQRGVPSSLLLDIRQLAQIEGARDSLIRSLFDRLNSDEHSALREKLSPAKSIPGKISRVPFNRAASVALNSKVLQDLSQKDQYKLLLNYINAFEAELENKKMLTSAAFFEAIFDMFDEVVRATLARHKNVRQASLQNTVRQIAKLDYSASGRLTKRSVFELMQTAFRESTISISAEML